MSAHRVVQSACPVSVEVIQLSQTKTHTSGIGWCASCCGIPLQLDSNTWAGDTGFSLALESCGASSAVPLVKAKQLPL
eukprot:4589161-Amphidinium_carterae.1